MIELLCPNCRRPSYTAKTQPPWTCPYCKTEFDLGLDEARLLIKQVENKQREIDREMERMEEDFRATWNQWGVERWK